MDTNDQENRMDRIVKHGPMIPMPNEVVEDRRMGDLLRRAFGPAWERPDGWKGWPEQLLPLPFVEQLERDIRQTADRVRDAWAVLTGAAAIHDDEGDW